jgi:peptide chain release factor 2
LKASEKNSGGIFDLDKKKKRLEEVNLAAENPSLWEKPDEMQKLNKEKSILSRAIDEWETYDKKLKDAKTLLEMSEEAHDEPTFQEAKNEVAQESE